MLDYLIIPLLACMRFRSLKRPAREILERVCTVLEGTPFAHEVPIYRDALGRAEKGFDFLAKQLPMDLGLRLYDVSAKFKKEKIR